MLSVVDPDAVRVEGLNDALAPEGSPVTLKLTVPAIPVPIVSTTL